MFFIKDKQYLINKILKEIIILKFELTLSFNKIFKQSQNEFYHAS